MFNIFNYAQDHNINVIENLKWWMLNNLPSKLFHFITGSNGLNEKRAEGICRLMFNHAGITAMGRVERLIGFGDDGEDFYYIIRGQDGKIIWHSMVGAFVTLKGKINNWNYYNIDSVLELNGCPKEKKFLVLKEEPLLRPEDLHLE